MYTERFSEAWEYLGGINPASHSAEKNSGYKSLANYERAVIIIHAGVLGGNVDIDVEQGTDTSGTSGKALDSNTKDITLTATTDDNTVSVIEIRPEEFDIANGFDCLNLEMTPASAGIFSAQIWAQPKYKPAATTNLDSVTD